MDARNVTDLIVEQPWTDRAADTLQKAVQKAFEAGGPIGQEVEDFLHGTWLGHPLHPVLTDLPIGAWTLAAVLDLAEATRRDRGLAAGADTAIGVGLVGAVGAAVTGLTDWHDTDGRSRKIGLVHGLLNLGATGLYATSWLLRRKGDRRAARSLGWLGLAVAAASAYLGGTLVYEERIEVNHADALPSADDFVPVLPAEDLLDNEIRRVDIKGRPVLLVRQADKLYALAETCSHLGGPLSEGELCPGSIRCPWHGSRFRLEDGAVLDGPSTYNQPRFEVRVHNGQIEVKTPARAAIVNSGS